MNKSEMYFSDYLIWNGMCMSYYLHKNTHFGGKKILDYAYIILLFLRKEQVLGDLMQSNKYRVNCDDTLQRETLTNQHSV